MVVPSSEMRLVQCWGHHGRGDGPCRGEMVRELTGVTATRIEAATVAAAAAAPTLVPLADHHEGTNGDQ